MRFAAACMCRMCTGGAAPAFVLSLSGRDVDIHRAAVAMLAAPAWKVQAHTSPLQPSIAAAACALLDCRQLRCPMSSREASAVLEGEEVDSG